jgi:hypothetical protein
MAERTFDNRFRHGKQFFELDRTSPAAIAMSGASFDKVTLDEEVGPEIVVMLTEPTQFADQLKQHEPFELRLKCGAAKTSVGPVLFLLWWIPPITKGKPFALYEQILNPTHSGVLEMLREVATQTHLHLLLIGRDQALLGVYEFESTFGLQELIPVSESACQDYGGMDFIAAKEEYDHTYKLMELFDMGEGQTRQETHTKPKPPSDTRASYEKLSERNKKAVLDDLKAVIDQGLLSPNVKPSFLGIGTDSFCCSQNRFEGNPLPEFCAICWEALDCFATALISTPALQFPASPLVLRCRLGEERSRLTLYLTAMLAPPEQILPLSEESEIWIGSNLRALAEIKGITLSNVFWDRSGPVSFFFFDYPGQMSRDGVPELGALGEDGKPRWPECELRLAVVNAKLRETARKAIEFGRSGIDGTIQ